MRYADRRHPALLSLALLLPLGACISADRSAPELRAVEVERVALDEIHQAPVVVLVEREGLRRELPIWIGPYEARSIALGLEQIAIPRPNPHDLIHDLLQELGGELRRVVVTELRDSVYYAEIELELGGQVVKIDARPSDAIAVAVRFSAPLFVDEEVLAENALEGDEEQGEHIDI